MLWDISRTILEYDGGRNDFLATKVWGAQPPVWHDYLIFYQNAFRKHLSNMNTNHDYQWMMARCTDEELPLL